MAKMVNLDTLHYIGPFFMASYTLRKISCRVILPTYQLRILMA